MDTATASTLAFDLPCPVAPRHLGALRQLRMMAIRSARRTGLSAAQARLWEALEADDDCLQQPAADRAWLLADHRDRALAFAVVRPGRLPHLAALYVDPRCQRRGLGSYLLRWLEARLAAHGDSRLATSACLTAIDFYRQRGYRPSFAAQHRGSGRDRNAVLAFRHLCKPLSLTGPVGDPGDDDG